MAQLFRILDLQEGPSSNEAMNRYWFDNPSIDTLDADDVAQSFFDGIIEFVRLVQSVYWIHKALFVEDVLQPSNSVLATITSGAGGIGNDVTPASNSWSIAFKPTGPNITRGGKRIPGVPEDWTASEVVQSGAPTQAMEALGALFSFPLTVGTNEINPAVVRPIGSPTPTEYLVSTLVGSVYRQIGTQVSRKLSRGGGTSTSSFVPFKTKAITGADLSGLVEADIAFDINTEIAARASKSFYEVSRSV